MIRLAIYSWEEALRWIGRHKPHITDQLRAFYGLKYNKPGLSWRADGKDGRPVIEPIGG